MKKKIAILGSTGSIGKNILDIVRKDKKNLKVVLLTANKNYKKLIQFIADRNPDKWSRKTIGTNLKIISEEESRLSKPDYFLILPWHFLDEFRKREKEFLNSGGKFIVPLPDFKIIEE